MRVIWTLAAGAAFLGLAVTTTAAAPRAVPEAPVVGGLVPDPTYPRRFKSFGGGPAFIASVGSPEGFLYRGTRTAAGPQTGGDQQAIIDEMIARRINCLYVIGFNDRRYGGDGDRTEVDGNPFIDADVTGNVDADVLNQWYGWFQQLDAAGIIVLFNIYDDLIDVLPGQRMFWDLQASGALHPQENKYVTAVVNKLKPLKNLVWSINESANKTYPASHVPRWKAIAARIRALDAFGHPIGIGLVGEDDPNVTPGTAMVLYANDPNIDLHLAQHVRPTSIANMYSIMNGFWNAAAGRYAVMLAQQLPTPANGATGRRYSWAAAMAGAYVMQAEGTAGRIWDVLGSPDADLNQLGYMKSFFQGIPTLNAMVPRNDLAFGNTQYVLAVAGQSYVAYSAAATSNLGVKGLVANARYDLKWLDTVDGSTVVQSNVLVTTASKTFTRPASIQPEAALYITKR